MNKKQKIAFRVDAGKQLGLGHVQRCLNLASILKKKNQIPIFIVSNYLSQKYVQEFGFETHLLKKHNELHQINEILVKINCKKIIFDTKKATLKHILQKLSKNNKIIFIDNLKYSDIVDLVFIPFPISLKNLPKNVFYGFDYVLLGPHFSTIKKSRRTDTILISFGGVDKHDLTFKTVSAMKKHPEHFDVIIVLGKFYKNKEKIQKLVFNDSRFSILENIDNLSKLMSKCSFGIMTYGISVFEALFCNLPLMVISHSLENDKSAKKIEKLGVFKYAGMYNQINYSKLVEKVINYNQNKKFLKIISSKKIIDNKASFRISEKIIRL